MDILDSGVVFPGRHCKDQMLRRQVFMPDIKEALSIGEVKPGQADGDDANCIFRVYGADVEGDLLIVVVKIDFDKKEIECITVF